MPHLSRRAFLSGGASVGAAFVLGGCVSTPPAPVGVQAHYGPAEEAMYGPIYGEAHPIPAVDLNRIPAAFFRSEVDYATDEAPGTIIVDPQAHYLYLVEPGGRARRYGVAVGGEGFSWSGEATVQLMREWPDWYPPQEMLERRPELLPLIRPMERGLGVPGGPENPLGARALYLFQGKKDTLYRIHGTNEPWKIGTNTSSGCIRMINQDAIDLYERTQLGAKVVVTSPPVYGPMVDEFQLVEPGRA